MIRSVPLRRAAPIVLLGPIAAFLAGCADTTPPAAPAPPSAAPAPTAAGAPAGAAGTMLNDPSAPTNTPLCGIAAREKVAIGEALLPRHYADAGICRSFACYDPATATYIGADGYRHVCR